MDGIIQSYLELFADYTLVPMIAMIVGISIAVISLLLFIFAGIYKKGKANALCVTAGIASPFCLVLGIILLLFFVYYILVALLGTGMLVGGSISTLTFIEKNIYGVLVAPCLFGMPLPDNQIAIELVALFYALLLLLPGVLGIVAFGVSCSARKKSKTARGLIPEKPVAQPAVQNYAQPMTQGYVQPMTQGYEQPVTQGYVQPMTQGYVQPMTQGYEQPVAQNIPVNTYVQPVAAPVMTAIAVAEASPIDVKPIENLTVEKAVFCKECGTKLSGPFCMNCGAPSPAKQEATPVAKEATPAAQETTPVAEEATPAAQETTPVAQEATPAAQETTPVAQEATPAVEEAVPVAENKFCTNCGKELGSAMFCTNCGTPAIKPEARKCNNCGNKLSNGAVFCTVCGTKAE